MLFLTNDGRFRNGKSIRLCGRQLRWITTLFTFERQFSGRLSVAGTNYEPSDAALIREWGQQAERQPAGQGRLLS